MGKARWWVCGSCSSLNDLPAKQCYGCHASKPSDPMLFDDHYSQVGGAQRRVGVSVDRSQVSELVRRDPVEHQSGGGIIEAFGPSQPRAPAAPAPPPQRPAYDPYGSAGTRVEATATSGPGVRPLRDPTPRGIGQAGGRHWSEGLGAMRPDQPAEPFPPPPRPSEPDGER